MEALGRRGGIAPIIHDLSIRWSEWSVSRSGRALPPAKGPTDTHWTGSRAGLDTEYRGKILFPCRGLNPDRPVVQSLVRHYTA
jgi:hypothetical protein